MALDTTIGGASADSYATLAEYEARAAAMGWTLADTDAANEANLRRAAVTLDATYAWVGFRRYSDGALDWPRVVASDILVDGWSIPSDTIPAAIKNAQMELAYALQGGADPLASVAAPVKEEDSQVGSLRKRVVYAGTKGNPRLPAVDRLVSEYVTGGAGQVRAVRA